MRLELQLSYPGPPADVAALLADRAFLERIGAEGGRRVSVEVLGAADGAFTVTTERWLPTDEMPEIARRFVGEHLHLRQVDAWDAPAPDGSRTGAVELQVVGAPVRARATTALRAGGAGCEQHLSGDLTASVPLIGSRVERAAEGPLVEALHEQEAAVSAELAARA